MCREYGTIKNHCYTCPLGNDSGGCQAGVAENQIVTEEDLVQIVEKWSREHPIKTRQSEFLKMFPNAVVVCGILDVKPCEVDKYLKPTICKRYSICKDCKKAYWSEEVE